MSPQSPPPLRPGREAHASQPAPPRLSRPHQVCCVIRIQISNHTVKSNDAACILLLENIRCFIKLCIEIDKNLIIIINKN